MKAAQRRHNGCSMTRKLLLCCVLLFSALAFVFSQHAKLNQAAASTAAQKDEHAEFVPLRPDIARARGAEVADEGTDAARHDETGGQMHEEAPQPREAVSLRGSLSVPKHEPVGPPGTPVSNRDAEMVGVLENPASVNSGADGFAEGAEGKLAGDAPRSRWAPNERDIASEAQQPRDFEPRFQPEPALMPEPEEPQPEPELHVPEFPRELTVTPQSQLSAGIQRMIRRIQSSKPVTSDLTCTTPAALLHQLLRQGDFTPSRPGDKAPATSVPDVKNIAKDTVALYETVASELKPTGLFLEYSASAPQKSLAFRYAAAQSRATVVHIHLANEPHGIFYKPSPSNLLVVPSKGRPVDELKLQHTSTCTAQLLAEWGAVVQEMLPHEYEQTIGRLLCQCDMTVAPAALPATPFFSYWGTVQQLIAEATAVVESANCKLAVETLRSPYGSSFTAVERQIKITKNAKMEVDTASQSGSSSSSSSGLRLGNSDAEGSAVSSFQRPSFGSGASTSTAPSYERPLYGSTGPSVASRLRTAAGSIGTTSSGESAHAVLREGMSGIALDDLIALGVADNDLGALAASLFDFTEFASSTMQYSDLVFVAGSIRSRVTATSSKYSSGGNNGFPYSGYSSKSYASSGGANFGRRLASHVDWPSDARVELHRKLVDSFSAEYANWLFPEMETGSGQPLASTGVNGALGTNVVTDAVRLRQAHLAQQESAQLKQWAVVLKEDFASTKTAAVFGRRGALLTAKLGKRLGARAVVVSWNPSYGQAEDHMRLLRVMEATNVVLTSSKLTLGRLSAAAVSPQRFDTCFIQADVFVDILGIAKNLDVDDNCDLQMVYDLAGLLLRSCDTAYVQLPAFSVLLQLVELLWPECASQFVQSARADSSSRNYVDNGHRQLLQRILGTVVGTHRITAVSIGKQANSDDSIIYKCSLASAPDSDAQDIGAVNWYSLMNLEPVAEQRKKLLPLVLQSLAETTIPAEDVQPWQVWMVSGMDGTLRVQIGDDPVPGAHDTTEDETRAHRNKAAAMWQAIKKDLLARPAELSDGQFSAVEYNSGYGYFSGLLAKQFPEATVLSIGGNEAMADYHAALVATNEMWNNAVCMDKSLPTVFKNVYESPEFFRFQFLMSGFVDMLSNSATLKEFGTTIGTMLSTALTTYLSVPSAQIVSTSINLLFPDLTCDGLRSDMATSNTWTFLDNPGPLAIDPRLFELERLPANLPSASKSDSFFAHVQEELLGAYSRAIAGSTRIQMSALRPTGSNIPIVRCDVLNMTRSVHHHYDYSRDGHSRTYAMRVAVNSTYTAAAHAMMGNIGAAHRQDQLLVPAGGTGRQYQLPLGYHVSGQNIVGVHLMRDRDGFHIPYVHIRGITLIAALRMGLHQTLRARAFEKFLDLPLYEDMAPWNVVLMGPRVDYIDYDTRDTTFDRLVPRSYQIMSALANYKRTVSDFGRCGQKSKNEYGLPFVSDCVGSEFNGPCPDSRLPVPCGDGTCHSDYISCLRAVVKLEIAEASKEKQPEQDSKRQKGAWSGLFEFGGEAAQPLA